MKELIITGFFIAAFTLGYCSATYGQDINEGYKLENVPDTFIGELKSFKNDGNVVNSYPWRLFCIDNSAEFMVRLGNKGYEPQWSHDSTEANVKLFVLRNEESNQMAFGVHAYEDDTACFNFYGKYE